uniref:Uncharacterized protein n=1 Tax=Romanomermis culicivorax TaxID=13658 RepID=A0A915JJP5_ROMCU
MQVAILVTQVIYSCPEAEYLASQIPEPEYSKITNVLARKHKNVYIVKGLPKFAFLRITTKSISL